SPVRAILARLSGLGAGAEDACAQLDERAGMTDSYTAYSYLDASEIRQFELTPEFGRVAPYASALTDAQRDRSRRLLADSLVISLHDHPVRFPLRMEETPEYNRTGRQHAA